MGFAFSVENFGCLERVRWQPDGVCALVGPNGAGKSTLLQAVSFLGAFQREGLDAAALSVGSGTLGSLKRFGSPPSDWIRLRVELDGCAWEVRLAVANGMVEMPTAENAFVDGAHVLNQPHGASHLSIRGGVLARSPTNRNRSALALALESPFGDADPRLATLASRIAACRCYSYEHLAPLRRSGSNADAASELDPSGKNAFSVLRNWRAGSREHVERDRFVRDMLRDAFPDTFADYDFASAGPVVFARFYGPNSPDATFPAATAHGVLVGMLHLAAVASAPDGSIVAIDEFENGLHPHAIRALLGAIRERARARGLTVVLATHSPTLLNCFDAEPERVFVIERSAEPQPRAVTDVKKREWLSHLLARAGAIGPSLFDAVTHDVESFIVADAGYQDCVLGDCAARTPEKMTHPKRYLRHLTGHAYQETRGGADALAGLSWGGVLENGAHARFARSLIADIAAQLDVPNPCEGGCAPETELKARGLLRNA